MKARTVMLYGSNLVMSTIAASLREKCDFQVCQIQELLPDRIEKLYASPPDVILFDLGAGQPPFAIPLLNNHPTLMLIGIDLTSNKMLVLSGQQSKLLTTEDLVKVIDIGAS